MEKNVHNRDGTERLADDGCSKVQSIETGKMHRELTTIFSTTGSADNTELTEPHPTTATAQRRGAT